MAGISLMHPVHANEVVVAVPGAMADELEAQGFQFHRSPQMPLAPRSCAWWRLSKPHRKRQMLWSPPSKPWRNSPDGAWAASGLIAASAGAIPYICVPFV